MRFGMWFSAFRVRNGYPSSVSKSSAKPGRSWIAGASWALAMVSAAVRTHFPKRVNARFMPSAMAAGRDHAAVVAVDEDVPAILRRTARVPDAGDELHLVRELLADLRRIYEKESVASHRPRTVLQDGLGNGRLQRLVVQIPAQTLLRVCRPYVIIDRTHDRLQFCVAGRLNSVDTLLDKLLRRFRER